VDDVPVPRGDSHLLTECFDRVDFLGFLCRNLVGNLGGNDLFFVGCLIDDRLRFGNNFGLSLRLSLVDQDVIGGGLGLSEFRLCLLIADRLGVRLRDRERVGCGLVLVGHVGALLDGSGGARVGLCAARGGPCARLG